MSVLRHRRTAYASDGSRGGTPPAAWTGGRTENQNDKLHEQTQFETSLGEEVKLFCF